MTQRKIDGRAFTTSDKQSYIFKMALKIIEGKITEDNLSLRSKISIMNIVQRYKERKITKAQIKAKAFSYIEQEVTIPEIGLCKSIFSQGFETIYNPYYKFKQKDTYNELYYYLPAEAIKAENISKIFRIGFNPTKSNLYGTQKNELIHHPNKCVIRVASFSTMNKVEKNLYKIQTENEGTENERINPKDIVSIQYNTQLKA